MNLYKSTLATAFLLASSLTLAADNISVYKCGALTDKSVFIVDASGSMMTKNEEGLSRSALAKNLVKKLANRFLAKAAFSSELYAIAPFAELMEAKERNAEQFSQELEARLPNNLEVFARPSLVSHKALAKLSESSKNGAVVFITDGAFSNEEHENEGYYQLLNTLLKANEKGLVYVISFASNQSENDNLKSLVQGVSLNEVYEASDLLTNEANLDAFVDNVFYKDCKDVSSISIPGVLFAFDNYELTKEGEKQLSKLIDTVKDKASSQKIVINGYTDNIGTEAYNVKLSEKRAQSVASFFENQGISKDRFIVKGQGKSFKFDNSNDKGRALNRRVEMNFNERQ